MDAQNISSDFPFKSKYIEINGSQIHYIDEGSGSPILFLHGNPTSSYLWRNIIPHLTPYGRCIAPDLIGMGKSDKPDIDYRFVDHAKYIEGFIEKMDLRDITFVVHDWGSALGFHYAMRHENNVRGLAFMEAIIKIPSWDEFPKDFKMGFKLFRTPVIGWLMIVGMNIFIEQILPKAIVRKLTDQEMSIYREPYKQLKDRKPIRQWPIEIPLDGNPADVTTIVETYNRKLQESKLPKLLFYGNPGGIVTADMIKWCKSHFKNLKTVDIGPAIHYLQEDNPHLIGQELATWFNSLV